MSKWLNSSLCNGGIPAQHLVPDDADVATLLNTSKLSKDAKRVFGELISDVIGAEGTAGGTLAQSLDSKVRLCTFNNRAETMLEHMS